MDLNNIVKKELPNGIRVLMLPESAFSSVSVCVMIGAGSRFEPVERAGCSHFIEHMLFKGTETRSAQDIAEEMDAIGGMLNAYTAKEATCIYSRSLRDHLPIALDVICDMLTHPRFAKEDMDLERGVIIEEIGMYEDSPEDLLSDTVYAAAWNGHPLGRNILGTVDTVRSLTPDDLRAHMGERYNGKNIVVGICGNFDCDDVMAQLDRLLGGLPAGNAPGGIDPAAFGTDCLLIEKPIEQLHFSLNFPAVASGDSRRHALNYLNSICGGSSSSRLFQRVREQLGLAYSVGSACALHLREGMFVIDAAVSPGNDEEAIRAIVGELCRLRRDGVTEDEFRRTREQARASTLMGLESTSSIASHMARGELHYGHIRTLEEIISDIEGVTAEQVDRAARDFIDFDNFSVCAVGKVRPQEWYISIVKDAIL